MRENIDQPNKVDHTRTKLVREKNLKTNIFDIMINVAIFFLKKYTF